MFKQFSGRAPLLSFFMSAMISSLLHSMDGIHTDAIHDIIMYQIIPNADYRMQRTLACVNTAYNKLIEDNFRSNKKRIEYLMQENGTSITRGHVSWNKDFSQSAWVTIEPIENGTKKLGLFSVGLGDNENVIIWSNTWDGYMHPVIDGTVNPLFNNAVGVSCYGYGSNGPSNKGVFKYSINYNGMAQYKRCVIGIKGKEKNGEYHFHWLLNFPVLLKAFLQSTEVSENNSRHWDVLEVYNLSGVTIPEDYKSFKRHLSADFLHYMSYDNLYSCLKSAIDGRYKEQQREKKMIENMVDKK